MLHAPGECDYCDQYCSAAQQQRIELRIAFTGHSALSAIDQLAAVLNSEDPPEPCPADVQRGAASINSWYRNRPYKDGRST